MGAEVVCGVWMEDPEEIGPEEPEEIGPELEELAGIALDDADGATELVPAGPVVEEVPVAAVEETEEEEGRT